MASKVYVDRQEGTTGLRLLDYLEARDDLELLRIDPAKRKDSTCLLYTSPSPRDLSTSRMPSSA